MGFGSSVGFGLFAAFRMFQFRMVVGLIDVVLRFEFEAVGFGLGGVGVVWAIALVGFVIAVAVFVCYECCLWLDVWCCLVWCF